MTVTVMVDGIPRDAELGERQIAMLAAYNVKDERLRNNIKAFWLNPRNPVGLVKIGDQ